MRYLTYIVVTTALVGAAILLAARSAAAAPHDGAAVLAARGTAPSSRLIMPAQMSLGQRIGDWQHVGRAGPVREREGRGGGGGGEAAAAADMAGAISIGMVAAEDARAAAEQDDAITHDARRYRSDDPRAQTCLGRGGRVYDRP